MKSIPSTIQTALESDSFDTYVLVDMYFYEGAAAFAVGSSYSVGDYVTQAGIVYQNTVAISSAVSSDTPSETHSKWAKVTTQLTSLPHDVVVSGQTYASDGGLTDYSPPQITSVVDREVYRITLLDHANFFKSLWDATGHQTGTRVRVRFGIPGNLSDFDTIYQGRIDGVQYDINFGEQLKRCTIECSSPFADLELVNLRMTTKDHQNPISNGDTCFDEVATDNTDISLRWGKKGASRSGGGAGGGNTNGGATYRR